MIFPKRDNSVINIYFCPVCQKYYTQNNGNMTCCVNHGPGTCCHFNEREISGAKVNELKKTLNGDK